jgi:cell division protein FtsZ
MASPLLEEGAIDGARGILINITGSSSLKLSEVNEASTLIQDAAHEDANIIFGAVLDERLGDEVKITVIATGFKEPKRDGDDRRERMLDATGLARPSISMEPVVAAPPPVQPRYVPPPPIAEAAPASAAPPPVQMPSFFAPAAPAPVVPVSAAPPPAIPAFAAAPVVTPAPVPVAAPVPAFTPPPVYAPLSIQEVAPPAPAFAADAPSPPFAVAPPAAPVPEELVPVPASVFDDDFFRRQRRSPETPVEEHSRFTGETVLRTDVRVPTFAGHAPAEAQNEHDELDIPAFLRRGSL